MRIAFVDTETTGLKPGFNRVIEVAIQIVDVTRSSTDVVASAQYRQRPDTNTPCDAKAFQVNGYHEKHADWIGAPIVNSAVAKSQWDEVCKLTAGLPLCGQNVSFDRDFIAAELSVHGLVPLWERRLIDLQSFSAIAAIKTGLSRFALHAVYDALGGPTLQEHRAMADVERGKFVFQKVAGPFFAA
jgi:DNA polymerase III alpha subunit (gram-positive type)